MRWCVQALQRIGKPAGVAMISAVAGVAHETARQALAELAVPRPGRLVRVGDWQRTEGPMRPIYDLRGDLPDAPQPHRMSNRERCYNTRARRRREREGRACAI